MIWFENIPITLVLMLAQFAGKTSVTFDWNGTKVYLQSYTIDVSNNSGTLNFVRV